jgi:flagellar protein FliT
METSNSVKPSEAIWTRWPSLVNGLQLFYDLTVQLIKLYQGKGEREERIEEMERLLSARDEAMTKVTSPTTDDERELLSKCKQLNDHLNGLLSQEKVQIQKDIKELSLKKESTNKYVNPYNNINQDGMFYDRKK